MRLGKAFWLALGCLGLALGAVGAVVPLLPAFPFLALAAYSFARGNERLHRWFTGTRLYRENIEGFLSGHGMTKKAKARVILTVTAVMGVGFLLMRRVPWGRAVLAVVWAAHVLLFLFGIRTIPDKQE
ncbi:MAG TPA: YbaN family protein [Candidatus Limnocylindria bacterium]|nr:YbaN family protein [Candidatus Limnocylindria bacterium]